MRDESAWVHPLMDVFKTAVHYAKRAHEVSLEKLNVEIEEHLQKVQDNAGLAN